MTKKKNEIDAIKELQEEQDITNKANLERVLKKHPEMDFKLLTQE